MKLCVASDSHGNFDALCRMLKKENPHCLLFLGDGVRDAEDAGMLFGCQVLAVAGNCDLMCQEPLTRTPQPEGVRLFLSHGHRFGVKDGLDEFLRAAQQAGAQAAFSVTPTSRWHLRSGRFLCIIREALVMKAHICAWRSTRANFPVV